MSRILVVVLWIGCLVTATAFADDIFHYRSGPIHSLRGTLTEVNYRSREIRLRDDITKLTRRFYVFSKPISRFKKGDEVRVYFRSGKNEVLSIVKMTPVEYIEEKQNKGYLLRAKPAYQED